MTSVIWSRRLSNACEAVAKDRTLVPGREQVMQSIRSRAREFAFQRIDFPMKPTEVAYFQALRSRLQFELCTHQELQAAWAEAYSETQARKQAKGTNDNV